MNASAAAAPRVSAIVPAAGRGVRFGGDKLLAQVGGEPLLNRTLRCLLDAGAHQIVVVTGAGDLAGVPLVSDARVLSVANPDPDRGMFSSIQTGVASTDADVWLVLPGDMPFVTSHTAASLTAACVESGQLVVPTYAGRRGHPLALPGRTREALLAADPGTTLKDVITQNKWTVIAMPVDDPGVLRDVDVRQDLR